MECVKNSTNKIRDVIKNEQLDIINIMYLEGLVSEAQKHGHIVCLPTIGFLAHAKQTTGTSLSLIRTINIHEDHS